MKTITIEIPDGKRAEWVDGVLTLVDDKPVEFKFKVGDRVKHKKLNRVETITECFLLNDMPAYKTKASVLLEDQIEIYTEPKDITERIKTFEDACKWCTENGHFKLRREYDCIVTDTLILDEVSKDLLAYLKLRIITCALNEGWEPTFEEEGRWDVWYNMESSKKATNVSTNMFLLTESTHLVFKSIELAAYAAVQFKDIYMDFCK